MRSLARFVRRSITHFRASLRRFNGRMPLPPCIQEVLLVCKGNVCRSPLAAAYVEARSRDLGWQINVRSAGIETTPGKAAHPLARAVGREHGLSLQDHATTRLSRELVHQANLILVMEYAQRDALLQAYPEAKGKVFQLGEFSNALSREIADPYHGTLEDFETCYQVIRASCDNLLQRIIESNDGDNRS